MIRALHVDDLDTGGRWLPYQVPDRLEAAYRAATGWAGPTPPRGMVAVVARLAYTAGRPMPPGGVLVEMSLRNLGPVPSDGRYGVRLDHEVLGERQGRRRVRVNTSLRTPAGADVAEAGFLLDWPAAA